MAAMATIDAPLPAQAAALGPVREAERIGAMDAARGVALLGILFVNMQMFAGPFGKAIGPVPPPDAGLGDVLAFYFVAIFCATKFYTLFSTLFGMGLVLQMRRAHAARRSFVPLYLRRLAVLALIGLAHAIFLWYGDILFMYSLVGVVLLLSARARPRTLIVWAVAILVVATLLSAGLAALSSLGAPPQPTRTEQAAAATAPAEEAAPEPAAAPEEPATTAAAPPEDPAPQPPFARLMEALGSGKLAAGPPFEHPVWIEAETEAFRDGGFAEATRFRALIYAMILVFSLLGFGWTIVAMFFVGAALMKSDFFSPARRRWHVRLAGVGVLVGLPLAVIASLLPAWSRSPGSLALMVVLSGIAAPLVSLGYLSLVTLWVASGRGAGLASLFGRAGRMALSVYLLETATATFLMHHWGLGLFGTTGRLQNAGIALAIYAMLLAFSTLWLRFFRMGPAEWAWRTLTYLRPQPLVRGR